MPSARYWSFTAYPVPQNSQRHHLHDSQIDQSDGQYRLTIAQSCSGVNGTCMAMGATNGGVLVMRLYVPVDVNGSGTGGVPLPTIGFVDRSGKESRWTEQREIPSSARRSRVTGTSTARCRSH